MSPNACSLQDASSRHLTPCHCLRRSKNRTIETRSRISGRENLQIGVDKKRTLENHGEQRTTPVRTVCLHVLSHDFKEGEFDSSETLEHVFVFGSDHCGGRCLSLQVLTC